ncbi:TatD family hydrolase [Natronocalculus amylovorans]|uniref:TatD family hydrolase n=1 Tax=Natronocalculus amylovorans TaxID=2917812 RepID=A0AAE3K7X3_9EURY|nr:TatD family hydrolase [Natronocalculus amylovorans]MCL9816702.1 TatD family hydrolase [Natronocalculus amylovorans]NUE01145.1 TatD family hydrolase [Halorubraceae archaeon YAN]
MEPLDTPVLDNHMHLDLEHGQGLSAVNDFVHMGGTHLLVVNKPSWHLGVEADEPAAFAHVFETTIDAVADATELLPGRGWPVLGVHPGLISRLVDERGFTPEDAESLMRGAIDVAATYVDRGDALALKSGRPHYEVTDAVWEASNNVMKHAFKRGAELDCAVQLHTEASEDLTEITAWAADRGLSPHKVVKHYAGGRLAGPTPSVMSNKSDIETAATEDAPFLMETDFIDDPDRPGAVLGLKTVPRRVRWLLGEGYDEAVRNAHIDTPKKVYDINTEGTLG